MEGRRGEQTPIPANIYPPHTPDALITMFEVEENLFRKELTAAERTTQEMRWVAASKQLNGGNLVTPVTEPGEAAESGNLIPSLAPARGGRGKKGMAQRVAGKFGTGKRAVNMRRQSAEAVIGEEIDLDHDTPEELERKAAELEKADKRQRAEAKVVRLKPRKTEPRGVLEDATPPAEPNAGETGSKIEAVWKGFNALASKDQLRFIHTACLHVGLDPLKMASPAVFGLAEEELELTLVLPAEAPPAIDDAPVESQAEQRDEAEALGADDLQDADDVSEAADQEPNGANLDADHLQEAVNVVTEAAHEESGGTTKCAYCNIEFESGDQLEEFNGQMFHAFCVEDGRRLAKAKQSKQIAVAA